MIMAMILECPAGRLKNLKIVERDRRRLARKHPGNVESR
jgi:hypothetical protein